MVHIPAWFRDLTPEQLHAHFRYLALEPGDSSGFEIEIAPVRLRIPVFKRKYVRKSPTISLLFRTTTFGRDALLSLHDSLLSKSYDVRVRRSVKKKFLSQCSAVLPVDDPTFPLKAVSILRLACAELDVDWPPTFAVGYMDTAVNRSLPGSFSIDSAAWRAGMAVGKAFGKLARKR